MDEMLKGLIDNIVTLIADEVSSKISTEIERKQQYPENMTLATAAEYVNLNATHMRRNLDELGFKYRKAGDKYLFRKVWLDEWMEKGAEQIQKNRKITFTTVKGRAL